MENNNIKIEDHSSTWVQSEPDEFNNVTVTITEGSNKLEVILERFTKSEVELIYSSIRSYKASQLANSNC